MELVELLPGTGWDSVGLHVGAAEEVEQWWSGGTVQRNLALLVDLLLEYRVTVLDVGRVRLDELAGSGGVPENVRRVLDLGARFGAQYVTARFGAHDSPAARTLDERTERFGRLAEHARPYRLRPLVAPVPVDRPELLADAVAVVAPSAGGLVLDIPVATAGPEQVEEAIVTVWEHLGYVRLSARQTEDAGESAAGLLATLPPHVPVALGGDDSAGLLAENPAEKLRQLHTAVDRMLEHPLAAARRLRDRRT
jgi:hypothetical protein